MSQPEKAQGQTEQVLTAASVAEESKLHFDEPLEPAELVLLRQFFELLAQWDDAVEGESRDE